MWVGRGVVPKVGRRAWSSRGESQTPPPRAHTRDEVKSSSSSVVSCHPVSIHSLVVSVCPSSQVFPSLIAMETSTAVCANVSRSAKRMKLRLVEYLDEENSDGDTNLIGYGAFVLVIFKRVDAFCQGLNSNHLGFRLSGFIVTPRLMIQVLYSFCKVLFSYWRGVDQPRQVYDDETCNFRRASYTRTRLAYDG
jgi:hypothetical protein